MSAESRRHLLFLVTGQACALVFWPVWKLAALNTLLLWLLRRARARRLA